MGNVTNGPVVEALGSSDYKVTERYTLDMTRDELEAYFVSVRSLSVVRLSDRRYHRGRYGKALEK